MTIIPPAPNDGEYLWDEANERWVPLIKTETGHPDIAASIENSNDII